MSTEEIIKQFKTNKINKNDVAQHIKKLDTKCEKCVNMFNSVCDKIGKHLTSDFPNNRELYVYNDVVTNITKKKPEEPISIFLVNVYDNDDYREAIKNGDEQFFNNGTHENLTKNDEDNLKAMFQFKSCWKDMSDSSKMFIKEAMKTLINICDTYLIAKCDSNKLKSL